MALDILENRFGSSLASTESQHVHLLGLIESLREAMQRGQPQGALIALLDDLVSLSEAHFHEEEQDMRRLGYPGLKGHAAEHAFLAGQVLALRRHILNGNVPMSTEVVGFLEDWLLKHIHGSDRSYATFAALATAESRSDFVTLSR